MSSTFTLSKYIIAIAIIVAFGYALFATHTLWRGPVFVYLLPHDKTITTESTVTIEGHARRAQSITINDFTATQDLSGYFAEEFALSTGENSFKVTLTDKFGHTKIRLIRIVKEGSVPLTPLVPEIPETLTLQQDSDSTDVSSDAIDMVL